MPLSLISNALSNLEKRYPTYISYVWGIAGIVVYTTSNYLVKGLTPHFPASQLLFFRSLQIFIYTYIFMVRQGLQFHYKSLAINRLLLARGFSGTIGIGLIYYALGLLPISDASVLAQVYPVMTGMLAVPVLGEKYEWSQMASAFVCLIGVIFVAQPPYIFGDNNTGSQISSSDRMTGTLLLLISGLSSAVVEVLVRKVGNKTNVGITTLMFGLNATLVAGVTSLFQGFAPVTLYQAFMLFWVGFLSFVGQMFRNKAFMLGNAGRVSNTAYFGIVFAYILEIFVAGTEINLYSLIGALSILSCMFIYIFQISLKERQAAKEAAK